MTDSKLNITHRLALEAELRQVHREEEAREERIQVRRQIALEITKAQEAIAQAEDRILDLLPTPLPENAGELIVRHPIVSGKLQQLERFETVFAPAQIDQADSIAKTILGESTAEPLPIQKPGRRVKSSGAES